jgi:hypothetical protein
MEHFRSWKRDGTCDVVLSQSAVQGVVRHARSERIKNLVLREYANNGTAVFAAVAQVIKCKNELAKKLNFKSWVEIERAILKNPNNFVKDFNSVVKQGEAAIAHADHASMETGSAHTTSDHGRQVILKVARVVGKCFGCEVVEENSSIGVPGWPKDVIIVRVKSLGFLYFKLFSAHSQLAGASRIAPGHVSISMNFGKPWFGPRVLEWQEIAAIAHETAHGLHFLMAPYDGGLPLSPLDVLEWPSVLMETLFYSKEVMTMFKETALPVRPPQQYLRMTHAVAIYEALLATQPTDAPAIVATARAAFRRLGGDGPEGVAEQVVLEDVALWLSQSDVQSKAGYLLNYGRAHTLIQKLGVSSILSGEHKDFFKSVLCSDSAGVRESTDVGALNALRHETFTHPFETLPLLTPDFSAVAKYYGCISTPERRGVITSKTISIKRKYK